MDPPSSETEATVKRDSTLDSEKNFSEPVDVLHYGDVYDEAREIDLGEDGKEKPIGTQLCTLPWRL